MAWILLYLLLVAISAWLAYSALSERWRRWERARTVVGVLVVFLPGLIGVLAQVLEPLTLAVIFCGFGLAGAITCFRDIQAATENSNQVLSEILDRE